MAPNTHALRSKPSANSPGFSAIAKMSRQPELRGLVATLPAEQRGFAFTAENIALNYLRFVEK